MELEAQDFYSPSCRLYFELFSEFAKDHPHATTDAVARDQWLTDGKMGLQEYREVVGACPSPLEWRDYVRDVKRLAMRRRLATAAAEIGETAKRSPDDLPGAVSALSKLPISPAKALSFKNLADAQAEAVRNPMPEHTLHWVHWPWKPFDIDFKPMKPGELVVIAARPGVGKSSMCRQIAVSAAIANQGVYFASLEMTAQEVFDGMVLQQANRPKADRTAYLAAAAQLRELPIQIDDASRSFNGIAAGAMKFCDRLGLEVIVIDYLGRMTDCVPMKGEMKPAAIGRVTSRCKSMAMELGCVVLLIAQVGRAPGKEGRDANMGDLKDSSDIEADADRVIILQIPKKFKTQSGMEQEQSPHDSITDSPCLFTEVFQDKGRSVGTAAGALMFRREIARFELPYL